MQRDPFSEAPAARWRPSASLETLAARARLTARAREFLASRGILEVSTPVLSQAGSHEPHLASLATQVQGQRAWLNTSPEYAMKRLLAAGSGPIFQFCPAFRDEPQTPLHNPEFTLLEWYRPGLGYRELLVEAQQLVQALAGPVPASCVEYRRAFRDAVGLDPHRASLRRLKDAALQHGLVQPERGRLSRADYLDFLYGVVVIPSLPSAQLVGIIDFPVCQASLARIRPGRTDVAERFELVWRGVELANGYQELTDYAAFLLRRAVDLAERRRLKRPRVAADDCLLEALAAGLPEGAGVALGFDRLLMLVLGCSSLAEVMAFDHARA
jgi:elongation factor P--(R)-beta-lysine ligase